ncbi:MAG: DUF6502 family protein [Geminicoccaceae bacterium]
MPSDKIKRFHSLFRRLFRPLARVLVAHKVTIAAAIEIMKETMVEVVEQDPEHKGHLTDSRVSLLTGLHRKDVRRLRRGETAPAKRSFEGACALIVAYWTTDARFLDSKGKPRTLLSTTGKNKATFQDLMRITGIDLPAATVLKELESSGIAAIDQQRSEVRLLKTVYVPRGTLMGKLLAFEKNLDAHLSAAVENLLADDKPAPFFERAAHFNKLSAESTERLDKRARELKQAMLETLNQEALEYQKRDSRDPKNRYRISFGAYLHIRTPEADSNEKPTDELSRDGR